GFAIATTASADFSLRLAASPFQAQSEICPGKKFGLHRTVAGCPPFPVGREGLRDCAYAHPRGQRLISGFCSSTHGFVPRFFQRCPRGRTSFAASAPCGSLGVVATSFPGGLSPPSRIS